jgi:regulator of sigma E protease
VVLRLEGAPPVTLQRPEDRKERRALVAALPAFHDPVLGEIVAGDPAEKAGLRPGDRIVSANGRPVRTWEEAVLAIQGSPEKPLALQVQRGGQTLPVTVTPRAEREVNEQGDQVPVGKIGAGPQSRLTFRRVGPLEAVKVGIEETWQKTELIVVTLGKLFTGQLSARSMGGLLTIGQASGESAALGLEVWLSFLAFFSVNLAVLNLLPIPILDGGHLLFLGIEAVRGRPLSVEARIRFSQVGLIIVVGLMLWANGNDVVRLVERYFGG